MKSSLYIFIMNTYNSSTSGQGECKRDTVSFIWIWLIFILKSLCLKSSLQMNLSPSSISLPFGFFAKTLALPQANDCSVLLNSPSSEEEIVDYLLLIHQHKQLHSPQSSFYPIPLLKLFPIFPKVINDFLFVLSNGFFSKGFSYSMYVPNLQKWHLTSF